MALLKNSVDNPAEIVSLDQGKARAGLTVRTWSGVRGCPREAGDRSIRRSTSRNPCGPNKNGSMMPEPAIECSHDLTEYLVDELQPLLDEEGLVVWYDRDGRSSDR